MVNADVGDEEHKTIDTRLETIVNRMFQRCFDDKQYKQVQFVVFNVLAAFVIINVVGLNTLVVRIKT